MSLASNFARVGRFVRCLSRIGPRPRFASTAAAKAKDNLVIFDTTLRDGEQSPGASLSIKEKLAIARQLSRLGVDVCEAGFPIASEGDFEAVQLIAKEVGHLLEGRMSGKPMTICGLARATEKDIQTAFDAVKYAARPRIHTFLATSDIHLDYKLKISREQCIENSVKAVEFARARVEDVEFSAEDAGRSDPKFLAQVFSEVIRAGATTINIPDTVGFVTPDEYGALFKYLIEHTEGAEKAIWSTHCHNDLGLAVANTLAGITNGARQVEVTVNGIGERAGNTSLEEIVMALHTRPKLYPVHCPGLDTTQIMKSSRMVSYYTGLPVQPNKAIVGANAFAHEAGIHQDGILKHAATYEIMRPEMVGLVSTLVMGKHSGKHAFVNRVRELGYQDFANDAEAIKRSFKRFKHVCDAKKTITDADIEALIADELSQPDKQLWTLQDVFVTAGGQLPTATVQLLDPEGKVRQDAALGAGPIEAIYKALARVCGVEIDLVDFRVNTVSQGSDSIGQVTIRIENAADDQDREDWDERPSYTGHGTSVDTLRGAAYAFVSAVNAMLSDTQRATKKPVPAGRVTVHPQSQVAG